MEEVSDSAAAPDPSEMGIHRVTFAQECMVTATNLRRGDNVGLDMEILSLAMERVKGTGVALSFDSEQGGEAYDDYGYIPVLQNLVGGHLQFLISPDGKMLRATGIPEWLARGMGDMPARAPGPKAPRSRSRITNAPPVDGGSIPTNAPASLVRTIIQAASAAPPAATPAKSRSPVPTALRNLFTSEYFRQMVEFSFLPTSPVRVGQEWKSQGDTLVGRNRFQFAATGKFPGWQQHLGTNCARVDVLGHLLASGTPARTNAPPQKEALKATLWIDTQLSFPITTILKTEASLPASIGNKAQGTNMVARNPAKSIQQNVTLTLLEATPTEVPSQP